MAAALFLASSGAAADLTRALASAAASTVRIGERIGAALPKPDPETGAPLPLLYCPFHAIVLADDMAPLRSLLDQAAPQIDLPASVSIVGTRHDIVPGDGTLLVAMLVSRKAGLTPAAFRKRWLVEHAPFGRRISAAAYHQLHADPDAALGLPGEGRFDGVGMVQFRDAEHAAAARAAPAVARDATRDEMCFIDHARSMLAMFRLIGRPAAAAGR